MSAWDEGVSPERIGAVVRSAAAAGYLAEDTPAVIFHDLDLLRARIAELQQRFPATALHALAIKANPLVEVLRCAVEAGAGLEAASLEEVHLALAAGCRAARIVYDSPAKTIAELRQALALGVLINADNLAELERIAELHEALNSNSQVGLRVNPLVGVGTIAITSVAGRESKFGVALDEVVQCGGPLFRRHPWLTGLHLHVGSQGCTLEQLVTAVQRIMELRARLHEQLGRAQITLLDIGGGLPATYLEEAPAPRLADYVARLQTAVPDLFAPPLQLVTEFGRAVQAGCGWALSRIEYIKQAGDKRLAVIHLGADFMMRPVYLPQQWPHRFLVLQPDGQVKPGSITPWTLAGPLCFAGDLVARDVALPELAVDDWVVIRDIGAYTLSLWSRHCSRAIPLVLGYTGGAEPAFTVLRAREALADVVKFWSVAPG